VAYIQQYHHYGLQSCVLAHHVSYGILGPMQATVLLCLACMPTWLTVQANSTRYPSTVAPTGHLGYYYGTFIYNSLQHLLKIQNQTDLSHFVFIKDPPLGTTMVPSSMAVYSISLKSAKSDRFAPFCVY